jgi:hypothetical protein
MVDIALAYQNIFHPELVLILLSAAPRGYFMPL